MGCRRRGGLGRLRCHRARWGVVVLSGPHVEARISVAARGDDGRHVTHLGPSQCLKVEACTNVAHPAPKVDRGPRAIAARANSA
eukprot:scaffold4856_cov29-Tisochrysis_lutea.AAC.4